MSYKAALSQVKDIAGIVFNNETGFVYEKHNFDNDYIILKLGSPLQFNENVQPACLPSSPSFLSLDSTKTLCFTSGWGKLDVGKLKLNELPVIVFWSSFHGRNDFSSI